MTGRIVGGVAAIALLVGVTACGGADETSGGTKQATVALYQAPTTLNPLDPAQAGPNQLIGELQWDSLFTVDNANKLTPRLASKWDVSADGKTYTFHLRPGLKWSDGVAFTSADVLYSYNLYANPATGAATAGSFTDVVGASAVAKGTAASISGFTAPDANTFTIKLTAADSALLPTLSYPSIFILPKHVYSKVPTKNFATNTAAFRTPRVGMGPYVFAKQDNTNQIEFKANPHYRTKLALQKVTATYLSNDAALARLGTGALDYAQVAPSDVKSAKGFKNVTVESVPGSTVIGLYTAIDSGKLADPRVRRAIMYAIDRKSLVKNVLGGQGRIVNTPVFGPDWAVPTTLTNYELDIPKAKALLAQAHWNPRTKVSLHVIPGTKVRDAVIPIIAGELKKVGINAVVNQTDPAGVSKLLADRSFDLLISQGGSANIDPGLLNFLVMCGAGGNLDHYCNKKLDPLLRAGVATNDQAARAKIYAKAQAIVNADLPSLPLFVQNTISATSSGFKGLKPNASPFLAFWNASEWSK